ncbi:hypothetical protein AB3R30_25635 [Leptolyngbyaceae cyanobacterium UHCC 1019]
MPCLAKRSLTAPFHPIIPFALPHIRHLRDRPFFLNHDRTPYLTYGTFAIANIIQRSHFTKALIVDRTNYQVIDTHSAIAQTIKRSSIRARSLNPFNNQTRSPSSSHIRNLRDRPLPSLLLFAFYLFTSFLPSH